ncbi:hypothetical protein SEA_MISCHIEF19_26 [Streptomyces phage Mischief19]|nr:hypothetical protein SEA_MISCHIEF19_26 [Streptomyces phage Mischief19]
MALDTLTFHSAASALLDCVCAELDELYDPQATAPLMGCPCRKMVIAGQAAADGCDGGCSRPGTGEFPGQLTVGVQRIYSTDRQQFPRELTVARDGRNCGMPVSLAVQLNVTVFRCAPLPTDGGCPPTPAELSASALQTHADMAAVNRGVLCCFGSDSTRPNGRRYVLGATTPLGPQGGCVGFSTLVTVDLTSL